MEKLNIVFAGTPDFAAKHLSALIESKFNLIAVYTQPDRPAGRGKKLTASAVKELAVEHELPVYQPENFKSDETVAQLAALNADIMIVVAYGLILPTAVLEIPRLGCLNVHGSLLPRWRGAAPIQRAIWAGDKETGVTIMQMNAGLDTGDMLSRVSCVIDNDETSSSLYEKLANQAPQVLVDTIIQLAKGGLNAEKQDESLANYAKKLSKSEALIDWSKDVVFIERCIRAFNPWPMSYFELDGKPIKVHKANIIDQTTTQPAGTIISADKTGIQIATGSINGGNNNDKCIANGILNLQIIQLSGKKMMPVADVLNSRRELFAVGRQVDLHGNQGDSE